MKSCSEMPEINNRLTKDSKDKKINWSLSKIFWIILIFSILVKLSAINTALYDDESNYAFAAANAYSIGFSPSHYSGLLAQWAFAPLIQLFGVHIFLLRLIPLLFSTFTIILTFILARRLYSEKAAFIASLIMITAFWHNLASLQVDVEGSILTFFYVLAIWAYINLQEKYLKPETNSPISKIQPDKQPPWFDLNISPTWKNFKLKDYISKEHILLTLALIAIPQVKNNGIFIFPVLFLISTYQSRKLLQTIKELFAPFSLAVLGNIFILGISYLLDPEYIGMLFTHGGSRVAPGISLLAIMMILFWATPYLLSFLGLSLLDKKTRTQKHASTFFIWAFTILIFVVCFVSTGDYSRYAMNIIPAISILAGLYLSKISWDKKAITYTSVIALVYLVIIYLINFLPRDMTPRVMEEYVTHLSSGNLFFLFSYTSPSGPIFGITMASFILTLATAMILFLMIILPNNKLFKISNKKHLILTLFAITIAFNIFLVSEFLFHPTSPDISEGIHEMENYVLENQLPYPIYSNNAGSSFMLDHQNEISNLTSGLPDFELDANVTEAKNILEKKGGTAIVLNWPPLPDYSPLWEIIESCEKLETFTSDNYEVGWVYSC